MKILVTGGAGFIGSHVVDLLIKNNHEVAIIDNLSSGKKENINYKAKFYHEDLNFFENIKKIFYEFNPEVVYHFAAQINLRKSIEDPIFDAKENILLTLNLLELSKEFRIKHFIFSSSCAVYGNIDKVPITENDEKKPLSPYGISKLTIEKYLEYYNKIHNLKYTSLRYSNVYGPRQNTKSEAGVIAIFLESMFAGKNPTIFGGTQTRDFIYVEDVANANLAVLNNEKSEIYNVGSGKEIDIIGLFSKINKYFKNSFDPTYKEFKKGEQKRICLDCKKIKNELNWEPKIFLDKGLDITYCWYLKNSNIEKKS